MTQTQTPEVSVEPTREQELRALIEKATQEDLSDDGRYFAESYSDLTRCRHQEIGEYEHSPDGKLVEFLWNNRHDYLARLASQTPPAFQPSATVGEERITPALHEGGRFREWSTMDLAAQCLSQAREQLDPEFSQFMTAVAERLSRTPPAMDRVAVAQIIDPTAWRNVDGYMVEQMHSDEALRKADAILSLATLHTAPPVATATVVEPRKLTMPNGDTLEVDYPDAKDWARSWTSRSPDNKYATGEQDWEIVESYGLTALFAAYREALAATPTPTAGER